MDLLNEENKNNLIIRDLQKLGKVLYHENDSFKFALEQRLKNRIQETPRADFKKLFSLKWVWVTAPATLLLFVMLAEAAEYAGLEIPPYQHLKIVTLPAVSQKVKQTAIVVVKKMEEFATGQTVKKQIEEKTKTASSITQSDSLIAFKPLTSQEKQQFIQEINAKLMEKQTSTDLQYTYSSQQSADFQPQKLAYDNNSLYPKMKEELKTPQKQIVKKGIINQKEITEPVTDLTSPAIEPQTITQHAKDIINGQKESLKKTGTENSPTPQKILSPDETKSNINTQSKEEQKYEIPVQDKPVVNPIKNIDIAKTQSTAPISTVKESETLSNTETTINVESKVTCQNATEIIINIKNVNEVIEKINNILYNFGITITDKKFSDTEYSISIIVTLEQYNKLIEVLKNASLTPEEKILISQNDCQEILTTIYLRKKSTLIEKPSSSSNKPLK